MAGHTTGPPTPQLTPCCCRPHALLRAQQAVKMTLLLSLVSVPINTAFGTATAILLSRNEFKGKTFVISMLDLPFSISPVVTGE